MPKTGNLMDLVFLSPEEKRTFFAESRTKPDPFNKIGSKSTVQI